MPYWHHDHKCDRKIIVYRHFMPPASDRKMFLAVPAMNESAYLPAMLHALARQTLPPAKVFVCVNQPDSWWQGEPGRRAVCEDNRKTLEWLQGYNDLDVTLLDRSSPGQGWQGKQSGAGWARKVLLDAIHLIADDGDLMVSMDADTFYEPDYLGAVALAFSAHPDAVALSAPFYHRLGPTEPENRALLRYELYMRHYFLNLVRINSPYAFIALGSAIALPAYAYRKVRGITPFKAGEDFYFLQKLRKAGKVLNHGDLIVYPSARLSARAGFGTGPAIGKGLNGDWDSYPFFPEAFFDRIGETYRLFPELYDRDLPTPMDEFLFRRFGIASVWGPLRMNFKTRGHFVRACHEKIDALRVLQYLKFCRKEISEQRPDEDVLAEWMKKNIPDFPGGEFSFASSPVAELDALRNKVFHHELAVRKGMPWT